jgi:hypothetical protein
LKTFAGEEAIDNFVETDFPHDTLLYNLVLDGNNTYYAEDILVHNKCSEGTPGNCGNAGGSCFVAGTMIEMAGKENCKIEDVEIGDELIGFDNVINTVVEFDHPKLGDRSLYAFNGGKPLVTAEHPFMTPGGWKAINQEATFEENPGMKDAMAGNLEVGDMISLHNGEWLEIESIEEHFDHPLTQVYNFKLDGNNTYVANGMVVHNKGGGGGCVIATHGIDTGGFSLLDKAKAEIWCEKTYHGKWYGEAFRRGYRHLGNRAIEQGNAHKHYSEFKEFVSYGRGIKKGFMLGLNYYFRTIQFFTVGLFVREK